VVSGSTDLVTTTLTDRGARLRDDDRHEEALPLLRDAVAAGEPGAPRLLALTLMETGDHEAAERVLVTAVDGGETQLAGLLGAVADDLEHAGVAEAAYRTALAAGDGNAVNDFGAFLRGQERFDEAIAVLTQAVQAGDDLAPGNLVHLYLEDLDDVDTAERLARAHLDERKPGTYTALASVLAVRGNLEEAEAAHRKAVELGAAKAHLNFALFLWEDRENPAAAEHELWLAKESDEAGWGYELGHFLVEHGRLDEAGDVLAHASAWGDLEARALLDHLEA
jgi:Tfp pilus assembly protein PilF